MQGKGIREGEVWKKKDGTVQEQITFDEAEGAAVRLVGGCTNPRKE